MSELLVALDPSLRYTGWCVVTCDGDLVDAGCIVTASKVDRDEWSLVKVHDDARCGREIACSVAELVGRVRTVNAALEAPLGSQDATAAAYLARANQAVVDGLCMAGITKPIFVSSYAAKEAATGKKKPKDPKGDVRRAVQKRWGRGLWDHVLRNVRTAKAREGAYDAAAVAVLALRQPSIQALRSVPNNSTDDDFMLEGQ